MAKARTISADDISLFLSELFEYDEHAKRVGSLANATLGVITSASLAVHAIGQGLAHAQGLTPKHAVKQVDRLLSNQGIEVDHYFAYWVPHLVGDSESVRVAMDWTEFPDEDQATLSLSLLTGQGRSMPLLWQTVRLAELDGGRPAVEDALLCRLYEVMPDGVAVTIIADRWFGDCALLDLLERELGFGYVIRIRGNHYITDAKGERRKAQDWVGSGGRARTLRQIRLTASHQYPVATAVCVKDKGMKEPAEWREEQRKCLALISEHQDANQTYLDEGIRLLELAQKAGAMFRKQPVAEKRRLLGFVLSNCTWKDGQLTAAYRQPFDLLAKNVIALEEARERRGARTSISDNWLPGTGSNRRPSD